MRALEALEGALQRGFRGLGRGLGRGRRAAALPPALVLAYVVLGAVGLIFAGRATETDIWKLWVHRGTRVVDEMDFADAHFNKSRLSSFLIEAKGGGIFDQGALEEIENLHAWLRDFEYTHVTRSGDVVSVKLDNICRRGLNEEPSQPCFMYSVLDCFREGQSLVHGQENNTVYHGNPYNNRPSFRGFDFERDVTKGFLEDSCMQWGNVGTNWKVILPQEKMKFEAGKGKEARLLSTVQSTHLILGALHEESLIDKGIEFTSWRPKPEGDNRDVLDCEKVNPDCNECAVNANVYVALDWKCSVEDGVVQPEECCGNMTEHVAEHQCVKELFQQPTIASFGTKVFKSCGIPLVSSGSAECDAPSGSEEGRRRLFAGTVGDYPADSDAVCTAAALTAPLLGCIAGASEACCAGLDKALAGSSDAASANCMCVESVHQGVKDNAKPLNVDWEGIIDACKAGFGATMSYFGEAGGSCPAPPGAEPGAPAPGAPAPGVAKVMGVAFSTKLGGVTSAMMLPGSSDLKAFVNAIAARTGKDATDVFVSGTRAFNDEHQRRFILSAGLEVDTEVRAASAEEAESLKKQIEDEFVAKPSEFLSTLKEWDFPATYVEITSTPSTTALDWGDDSGDGSTPSAADSSCDLSEGQCSLCVGSDCSGCMRCGEAEGCAWEGFFMYGKTCTNVQQYTVPEYFVKRIDSVEELKELVDGWEQAWGAEIEDMQSQYQHINVFHLSSSSISKVIEDASKGQAALMTTGFLLILLYVVLHFSLTRSKDGSLRLWHQAPGPTVSVAAVLSIVSATLASFGVACFMGLSEADNAVKLNPLTFQILPFLTLGLGINDFFIMAKHLEQTVAKEPGLDARETVAQTLGNSGAAITMSSLAVIAACISQELRPGGQVPAVQSFAFQVILAVALNYLVAVLAIPGMLFLDVKRARSGHRDPLFRALGLTARSADVDEGCATEELDKAEAEAGGGLPPLLDRLVRPPAVRLGALALLLAFTGLCAWGASQVQVGLKASEIAEQGTQLYDFATRIESDFQTYPVYLYTRDLDYSDLKVLSDIRASQYAFVDEVSYADKDYKESSWLYYYLEWAEGAFCSGNMCESDTDFIYDPFRKDTDICSGKEEPCADLCAAYCPQNPNPDALERCTLSPDSSKCFCPWRAVNSPRKFKAQLADFLEGSTQGEIATSFMAVDWASGEPRIEGASTVVFLERQGETDDRTIAIKETRAALDKQAVDTFAYSGTIFGLGEQYLHIRRDLFVQVGLALATVLVVMSPLIVHPGAAAAAIFALLAIEVQVYGILYFAGMRLNAVTLMNLMMAVGFGVEFCAHYARSFMLARGDRVARTLAALREIGPPIVSGGLTTFLSILPVAFSGYKYFITYFFGFYAVLIAVCLANSLILLPALLSFVGPAAYNAKGDPASPGKSGESAAALVP